MSPETFAELKAAEILISHLMRDFLSRQENPVELCQKIKESLLAQEGLDNPVTRKAAVDFFDFAVGPSMKSLGHDYKTESFG